MELRRGKACFHHNEKKRPNALVTNNFMFEVESFCESPSNGLAREWDGLACTHAFRFSSRLMARFRPSAIPPWVIAG